MKKVHKKVKYRNFLIFLTPQLKCLFTDQVLNDSDETTFLGRAIFLASQSIDLQWSCLKKHHVYRKEIALRLHKAGVMVLSVCVCIYACMCACLCLEWKLWGDDTCIFYCVAYLILSRGINECESAGSILRDSCWLYPEENSVPWP